MTEKNKQNSIWRTRASLSYLIRWASSFCEVISIYRIRYVSVQKNQTLHSSNWQTQQSSTSILKLNYIIHTRSIQCSSSVDLDDLVDIFSNYNLKIGSTIARRMEPGRCLIDSFWDMLLSLMNVKCAERRHCTALQFEELVSRQDVHCQYLNHNVVKLPFSNCKRHWKENINYPILHKTGKKEAIQYAKESRMVLIVTMIAIHFEKWNS